MPRPWSAGERTTVNGAGVESTPQALNLPATLDWQNGRLAFEGESLRGVVEDVNRYTARSMVIADGHTALKITGTVLSSNALGWA